MSGENSFLFAEYARPVTRKGKYGKYRLLLVLSYVLFAALYIGFFVAVKIPQVIAVLPAFVWILVFFTWGLVSFEYRVKVDTGVLSFGKLREKKEKVLLFVAVKELITVEAYTTDAIKAYRPDKTLDVRSDSYAKEAYFAVFKKGNGTVAVLFEASDHLLAALRYYNKEAVRVKRA